MPPNPNSNFLNMYAAGSCYLIRQSAGSEQYAGASVRVRRKQSDVGRRDISLTAYRTGDPIDDAEFLREYALKAIQRFERDHRDLSDWDIEIFEFAYHPVDTSSRTTCIAVYNALVAALSAWSTTLSAPTDDRG